MAAAENTIADFDKRVAFVRPPAKLNLFLELLARRDDGFHEIDTVMVPIDWCDEMKIRRTEKKGVRLSVDWIPSAKIIATRLGRETTGAHSRPLMSIPDSDDNLVHRALKDFANHFDIAGGFECQLYKSIPPGAGMGGASSDAASALRCAAELCGFRDSHDELRQLAEDLGSDVPFFLGLGGKSIAAARARGRGEQLEATTLASPLHFVVVFPNESLSTAAVYAASQVPASPRSAKGMVDALADGRIDLIAVEMMNRLMEPAKEIGSRIDEILESLWQQGLPACQLTGSGSACFAVATTPRAAQRAAVRLRNMLEPGALVYASRTIRVPSRVQMN